MHLSSGDRFYLKICALIISDGEKIVKICRQKPKILYYPPKIKIGPVFWDTVYIMDYKWSSCIDSGSCEAIPYISKTFPFPYLNN